MILEVFLGLSGFGFAGWILGALFDQRGAAAVGAVVIVGVGVMVIGTGLEYHSGTTEELEHATVNNTTIVDNSTTTKEYSPVPLPQQFGLGFIVVLLGSSGLFRALEGGG